MSVKKAMRKHSPSKLAHSNLAESTNTVVYYSDQQPKFRHIDSVLQPTTVDYTFLAKCYQCFPFGRCLHYLPDSKSSMGLTETYLVKH